MISARPGARLDRRSVSYGLLGNVIEWYEFGVYGYLANVLGQLFFPSSTPQVQLVASFSVFGAGFLMRPLGSLVFGSLGDRIGRGRALTSSILLMSVATSAIGLLPTHGTAGLLGTSLLAFCRLLQGFSVGGEYGGSITYLFEHAPGERRFVVSSYAVISTIGGIILGSLAGALLFEALDHSEVLRWGWRVPFLAGGAAGILLFLWRSGANEPREFRILRAGGQTVRCPLWRVWQEHRTAVAKMAAFLSLQAVAFYVVFVLAPTLVVSGEGEGMSTAYFTNVVALLFLCLLIPLAAALAERMGHQPILFAGTVAYALAAWPLLSGLEGGNSRGLLLAQLALAVPHAAIVAPTPALLARVFPTGVRYSGVAVAYNLGISLFGGLAPLVVVVLEPSMRFGLVAALLLGSAAAVSLLVLFTTSPRADMFRMRESRSCGDRTIPEQ